MTLKSVLLAVTVLAAPLAAMAQPVDGPYLAAGVGANYRADQDVSGSRIIGGLYNGLNNAGGKLRTDVGFIGLASVGYGFGNGLRVEVEGNYRENQIKRVTGAIFPTNAGGTVQTYGGMVNALFDFDVGAPVYPYIGVGVGYGEQYLQSFRQYSTNPRGAFNATSNAQEGNFAYQAMAGLAFPLGVPGLSLTTQYRFYGILGDNNYSTNVNTATGSRPGNLSLKGSYNHAGLVGIRYQLFNPPPPAPPAPVVPVQQAPARSFLVFFDWDKATLTDRARQIIREAANTSKQVQTTRIEVNGFTDTSGTAKYNLGLSVRRADAVAAELVRDGVPKSEISIHGYGETRLLVQTADGVREPQNRRVEIILK